MLKHFKKSVHLIVALVCSITLFLAGAFIVPKPIDALADGPDDSFQRITFNSLGIEDGVYDYNNNNYAVNKQLDGTFDKKYFVGDVTFSANGANLYIAGTQAGKGIGFTLSGTQLVVSLDGTQVVRLIPQTAGVGTTFKNKKISLGVTLEKSGAALKIGVYINDSLYGTVKTVANGAAKLGETVSIKCSSSASITVASDGSVKVLPDSSLEWITTTQFYVEDGIYGYNNGDVAVKGSRLISVNNSYFTANVKFSTLEGASLLYGGREADGGRTGLKFNLLDGKLVMTDAITTSGYQKEFIAADAGLTSFVDTQFKLGISIKTVNADDDGKSDDIELGVWFNDTLYGEEYIYFVDFASYFIVDAKGNFGNTLSVVSDVNGSTITLGAVADLVAIMPDNTLTRLTFEHFGISAGKISSHTVGTYNGSIENTYFSGVVYYNGAAEFMYATAEGGWPTDGLDLVLNDNGDINLRRGMASYKTLTPEIAGVESFSKAFRIGISVQFVDNNGDGNKNDVKLGIYFNEALYNDDFFIIDDYASKMLSTVAVYCTGGNSLTVNDIPEFKAPITSRPLDSSFKKFTFDTVSILDKKYTVDDGLVRGAYSETMDGAAFGGTVTFSAEAGSQMLYAATAGNAGMTISLTDDGRLRLGHNAVSFPTKYFIASKAGLESFVDTKFNLTISTRYVDSDNDGAKDDVELGMWFNDILYADEFIYLTDYVGNMDKYIYIYCPPSNPDTTLTVGTRSDFIPVVIPEELDEDLKLITLNNFSIKDNVYEDINGDGANGLVANGAYLKSLGGTYFAFNANFSIPDAAAPISFQYAGKGDGWAGFCFEVFPDRITVGDNAGRSERYTFYAVKCGLDSFAGKDIKLGVSTQYLDLDADGAEDDVRFGLWINDKLANNEYMNVIDYRQYIGDEKKGIGGGLGIYIKPSSVTENGKPVSKHNPLKAKLSSVLIPVKFQQFGFTENWERELDIFAGSASHGTAANGGNTTTTKPQSPQTGEGAHTLKAMIVSCVALGGIMNIGNRRKAVSI